MKLLVINPNTTASVTTLLLEHVRRAASDGIEVEAVTARFGASYIADETSFAVAGHAVLDAWAEHRAAQAGAAAPDAVLVGCFGDPGCAGLRELSGRPVIGLAEAAMREAAAHGRFAIVTGGAAWKPMLAKLARTLDLAGALAGIHVVAPTGDQLAADPEGARAMLRQACIEAAREADCIVLGGAALAGMADTIAPALRVPLVDSVEAGARAAVKAARMASPSEADAMARGAMGSAGSLTSGSVASAVSATTATTSRIAWSGLSAALLEGLRRRP